MVSLINLSVLFQLACMPSSQPSSENSFSEDSVTQLPAGDERIPIDNDEEICPEHINYQTVAKPFLTTWCTPCHNSNLTEGERAGAYINTNFDDYEQAIAHSARILARIQDTAYPMPPAGGVPSDVLDRMVSWIECGMPE